MEKQNVKTWLKEVILNSTEELRKQIEGVEPDERVKAIRTYFEEGDLKKNDVRIGGLKKLFKDLGAEDKFPMSLSVADMDIKMKSIRFSLMKMTGSAIGHDYGQDYFLVTRDSSGIRQNGSLGNTFPAYETCAWKVPDASKAEELADKYVAMLSNKSSELYMIIAALKTFLTPMVDFSDF